MAIVAILAVVGLLVGGRGRGRRGWGAVEVGSVQFGVGLDGVADKKYRQQKQKHELNQFL